MSEPKRLIIITVPPKEVCDAINAVRQPLAVMSDAAVAMRYPPHVTLRTGVIVPMRDMNTFLARFAELLEGVNPFAMGINGIHTGQYERDDGPQPIVAFKIVPNDKLRELNRKLLTIRQYCKSNRTTFQPHLSIAYEDLSIEGFENLCRHIQASKTLQEIAFEWVCDNVSFYEQVNGQWVPFHVISL